MKRITHLCVFLCLSITIFSQSYPGSQSGNYTGVNGAFFNPASIADNKYKWSFNLFSLNGGVSNTNASFNLKNIGDVFKDNVDSVFLGSGNKVVSGLVNADIIGPSVMFAINRKTSLAITSRMRVVANVSEIDGGLIDAINNDANELPFSLNSNRNQKIAANAWADIGLSFGRVLVEKGKHYLKAGVTVKYLAGSNNAFVNMNKINATVNEDILGDVYVTNASGTLALGHAGTDFDNLDGSNAFDFNGSGIGADLGLIYEYRPNGTHYKFKAGLSLLDVGAIKYTPNTNSYGSYTMNINQVQRWYPADLDGKSIEEIKDYFDSSPYFTNNSANLSSYKASLPTNLLLTADWALTKNVFVDIAGQLNLAGKENAYSSFYANSVSITPRFETRLFSAFLPINYNEISNLNAGLAIRIGPLFFGSGSVLTALVSESKQADFHVGLRFGGLRK